MPPSITELLDLPDQQKMEIAETLWLSVAEDSNLGLSEEHRIILEERLQAYESGTVLPISHEELMQRLAAS